ncbi:MAG: DNA polymerase III subunit beta [bacterium]|nr:DNA polymerase III subunit beta [bacterium]MDA1024547.1 DNA polymerase III subunit beta [bacterium]
MKFSCTKENLRQGLAAASHVSTKDPNYPFLEQVLIKARKSGVELFATNMHVSLFAKMRAKVDQEGEYAVPSKLLFDYVNLLPDERIDVDLIDEALLVKCGRGKTTVKGDVGGEFPVMDIPEGGKEFTFSNAHIARALSEVSFSMATTEARPELVGVSIQSSDRGLVLASTDSYRLSETLLAAEVGGNESVSVILPKGFVTELQRVLALVRDNVETTAVSMRITESQVVAECGGIILISDLVAGNYPDYTQVIPSEWKTDILFEVAAVQKAIKAASLFSRTGLFDIYLTANVQEQMLELRGEDSVRGKNVVEIPAAIDGEPSDIAVNFRYLLDGLSVLPEEKARFRLISRKHPCLLTSPQEASFRYIVMPIRQ